MEQILTTSSQRHVKTVLVWTREQDGSIILHLPHLHPGNTLTNGGTRTSGTAEVGQSRRTNGDSESGHPVFRATSPLSRGTFKSKGGGKLSIHFCAVEGTIDTVFRIIISVNQLNIYGAVSDLCDEYSASQARTGRPVLA